MRAVSLVLLLAGSGVVAACSESAVLEPPDREAGIAAERSSGVSELGVITRNLYVGTDVDAVIAALGTEDPTDDAAAMFTAIGTIQRTDFPTRASAIADEIARAQPHAVGLQEVSRIDLTLPLFGVDIHQDFLATLQAELIERGLEYDPVAQIQNIAAAPFPGVSLVDFDVLLVRRGITVSNPAAHNFETGLGEVAPGVVLNRGWVAATLEIDGQELRVASTHLESGNVPGLDQIRAAQIGELIASLSAGRPAVLMGDLNDAPGSPMYQALAGAGFADAWRELRPRVTGNTCCHAGDLSNELPDLSQRIDYIFARGLERPQAGLIGTINLLGNVPADRLAGPASSLWPSDHAGLAAALQL